MRWPLALGLALAAAGAIALHATRWAPYRPVLRRRSVQVPASWPALAILHLSDLHLRRSDLRSFRGQVNALARLAHRPDLVCVTGDMCERLDDVPLVVELLGGLKPRLGTYAILGNHEYGAGAPGDAGRAEDLVKWAFGVLFGSVVSSGSAEGEAIAFALAQAGLQVLRNEGRRLVSSDRSVWLAGVDSRWASRDEVPTALQGRQPDEPTLVLVHEPELAFQAIDGGADLVLAGHTHGGQVVLPLIGALYWHRTDPRLTAPSGIQSIGQAQLHISAGMGQLFALRFRCPPELVWLQCVPASETRVQDP